MASPSELYPLAFAAGGVRGELHPLLLNDGMFQRATNVRLHKRIARTAHGWECVPVEGDAELEVLWRRGNTQGAWYFNPGLGQSAIRFTSEAAQILHSVAGRMFRLSPAEKGGRFTLKLTDASGGLRHQRTTQLAWGEQGESYFVRTDGTGKTWILDGRTNKTRWSTGYTTRNKDASELPNYAGPVRYAHGRFHVGVRINGMNGIIVGDPVHRTNYSGPENILATTEQVYLATGYFLSPPSSMGAVMSMEILPLQDTQHGHGELFVFCPEPGGTWSANTNVWPRTEWATQVISRHALLDTAAAGPFASCPLDGDIPFRSRKGIQSLRSARAERQQPGGPYHDLAAPVRYAMAGDFDELLRFCSMSRHIKARRIFCTVRNFAQGVHRWHRGFVVACQDLDQGAAGSNLGTWEGLRCLPPEAGGPVQFVRGIFSGKEELFAICWNQRQERHTVWRYRPDREHDTLEDGSRKPVESRIVTRQLSAGAAQAPAGNDIHIIFRDIIGSLTWEVSWRQTGGPWKVIGSKHESAEAGWLPDGPRHVGKFPQVDAGRHIEFLIRWRGAASVMLRHEPRDPEKTGENLTVRGNMDWRQVPPDDDYEYNNGSDWADNIIARCQPN